MSNIYAKWSPDSPMLDPYERQKLFGPSKGKRSDPKPMGYAATPGTGPEGETCGSCAHLVRKKLGKTYLKCDLMREIWTGGGKTDIRARSPACAKWEA